MASVLYITYDGLLEPLGQSQVWRYVQVLAREHRMAVLSFEKQADLLDGERLSIQRDACTRAGVEWVALRYHKRPTLPATAYDVARGILTGFRLARRRKVDILHARSYVAALVALVLKFVTGSRFIFDMRGFWADEKVDSGVWKPSSALYQTAKWFERLFLTHADKIVSLTQAAAKAIAEFPYMRARPSRFAVIPTCTDMALFSARRQPAAAKGSFVLCYLGSVGTRYLFDEVLDSLRLVRRFHPTARLLVLNRGQHAFIRQSLEAHCIDPAGVDIRTADHHRVASELANADVGVFFYKPGFSALATGPTKLGEFLACGLPCLANAGIGDYEAILEREGVGVVVHGFGEAEKLRAIHQLLNLAADPGTSARCRQTAMRLFSLEQGARAYSAIYRALASA